MSRTFWRCAVVPYISFVGVPAVHAVVCFRLSSVFMHKNNRNLYLSKRERNDSLIELKPEIRHQREIVCYYPTEIEETITQLVAGSIVEVKGRAQLGEDGAVLQIDEVLDVSTIDLSPFRTSSFHFNDRRFVIKEPVICSLEYRNNLWVYECPRYGLHASSEDRQEALRQLGEEFAFLYEGLINEPDENLTLYAIELRDLLKADSVRVKEI